jgi:hypothetical protein
VNDSKAAFLKEAALSRGDLTDAEWRILDPLLPDRGMRGSAVADKRRTVNGTPWVTSRPPEGGAPHGGIDFADFAIAFGELHFKGLQICPDHALDARIARLTEPAGSLVLAAGFDQNNKFDRMVRGGHRLRRR